MSSVTRPLTSFWRAAISGSSNRLPQTHLPEQAWDSFEHEALDPMLVQTRLATLRSREADLSAIEAAELFDLNEAQRLQQAIENGSIQAEEVRDAERLTHLRQAFANVEPATTHHSVLSASPSQDSLHISTQNAVAHEEPATLMPGTFIDDTPPGTPSIHSPTTEESDGFFSRLFNLGASHTVASAAESGFTPLRFEALFGANPRHVTIDQGNSSTCHTLAPLHSILNHPQAREILNLINYSFHADRGVYRLDLPNREPIEVPLAELHEVGTNAHSSHIGVPLLEAAFLRASQASRDTYNSAAHALTTLFGESQGGGPGVIRNAANFPLEDSLEHGMYDARNRVADIWVAAAQHISQDPGRAAGSRSTGGHYYGVSLSPDRQHLNVFNPKTPPAESGIPKIYHLPPVAEALNQNEHNQAFMPELIQIQL